MNIVYAAKNTKEKPELILMYTWDIKGYYDNKICGHMYEIIDYYWILKDYFNIKIIFPDNYDLDLVLSKYNFINEEKIELLTKIIPRPKSGIIKTTGGKGLVLIVDGNLGNFKGIIYGIPVQFTCGKLGLIPKDKVKWYMLHDDRICKPEEFEGFNLNPPKKIFNYNKKVLLNKLRKPINKNSSNENCNSFLFYLTSNCKFQTEEEINKILQNKKLKDNPIYIIADYDFDKFKLNYDQSKLTIINISKEPIDIFSLDFDCYIYTNVKRQWDCSNRLIVECLYHNRKVLYEIDYVDNALETRIKDLYDKVENYNLKDSDIIKDYLNMILEIEIS